MAPTTKNITLKLKVNKRESDHEDEESIFTTTGIKETKQFIAPLQHANIETQNVTKQFTSQYQLGNIETQNATKQFIAPLQHTNIETQNVTKQYQPGTTKQFTSQYQPGNIETQSKKLISPILEEAKITKTIEFEPGQLDQHRIFDKKTVSPIMESIPGVQHINKISKKDISSENDHNMNELIMLMNSKINDIGNLII